MMGIGPLHILRSQLGGKGGGEGCHASCVRHAYREEVHRAA